LPFETKWTGVQSDCLKAVCHPPPGTRLRADVVEADTDGL
jgi:hypothetical protein